MKFSVPILGVIALALLAGPTAAMATTTCPNGVYNLYVFPSPLTCATNELQFSQFMFAPGGTSPPTASSIGVTVVDIPGNNGFSFNPAFSVANGQSSDATIQFEVTGLNGFTISDLSIFFNGSSSGTGSSTSFSETYCTTDFTHDCNVFSVNNPPGPLSQDILIPPVTTLFITKDFGATAGSNGAANISVVTNQFSVPEPGTLSLLGLGLAGIGFMRLRKTS